MEEDIYTTPLTATAPAAVRAEARLKRAMEEAQERIDYEAAHNSELLRALATVHQFLKQRQRVCYGGTAMNAILPPKRQFYDPETDLPDYDFFSPDPDADIAELVGMLKRAGFKDVYHRTGIHEGTKKILVNFVPIADISALPSSIYSVFHRRAIVRDGVYYTDPDCLRMMMYLELSRPKGMVSRWEKVYERLQLINAAFPPKRPRVAGATRKASRGGLTAVQRETVLNFVAEFQRILLSGNLDTWYERAVGRRSFPLFKLPTTVAAIAFLTPTLKEDAAELHRRLGGTLVTHAAKGEIVPAYMEIQVSGKPICILFQETACHSFISVPMGDGRMLPIASMDTLITMYYSIVFFTKQAAAVLREIPRALPRLVATVERNRLSARASAIPAFPLQCRGYQKGYATLLREKVQRIQREKGETEE